MGSEKPWLWRSIPLMVFCVQCLITSPEAKSEAFIYAGCSQDRYDPASPFNNNLNSMLTSFINSASAYSYNNFSVPDSAAPIYGLYQCRGDLSLDDCSNCVRNAIAQLTLVCANAYGGGLQLDGCFVRYQNFDFLGKLDTSMVYSKCSKSSTNDAQFFTRRDDVLGDLQSGKGFKVSSASSVQGYGQCLGDLSSSDCTPCLATAVDRLKTVCGPAMAGDVYLAKCYARYWAAGYYPDNSPGDSNFLMSRNHPTKTIRSNIMDD
ncbi:Cysteine-rich repeat secretory protein 15 [Nymphaea thermarum]|nr:Cysteine-rich repeat secretory protein 15 [Nymphaea thermarum]